MKNFSSDTHQFNHNIFSFKTVVKIHERIQQHQD